VGLFKEGGFGGDCDGDGSHDGFSMWQRRIERKVENKNEEA
jgi:hypothetical protein